MFYSAAASMGSAPKTSSYLTKDRVNAPGPGYYQKDGGVDLSAARSTSQSKGQPSWTIGDSKRPTIVKEGLGPGPAAYDTHTALKLGVVRNVPAARFPEDAMNMLFLAASEPVSGRKKAKKRAEKSISEDQTTKEYRHARAAMKYKVKQVPGPGSYNNTMANDNIKSYTIGDATRYADKNVRSPGPKYNTADSAKATDNGGPGQYTNKHWRFGTQQRLMNEEIEKKGRAIPSCVQYSPEKKNYRLQITLGQKLKDLFASESMSPGPGQYQVTRGDIQQMCNERIRMPQDFEKQQRLSDLEDSYQHAAYVTKKRQLIRSTSVEQHARKHIAKNLARARKQTHSHLVVPGPGEYETSTPMHNKVLGGAFMNSIRPQLASKGSEFEPGPNDYRPMIAAVRPHRPAPRIPDSSFTPSKFVKGEPGSLQIKKGKLSEPMSPAKSPYAPIKKLSAQNRHTRPGPGSYTVDYKTIDAHSPSTHITGRFALPNDKLEFTKSPGPMYKPRTASILSHKPAYHIGGNTLQRPDLTLKTASEVPGPGEYFSQTVKFRPKSMNISKRKKLSFTPKNYGIEVTREKTPAWTFAKSSEDQSKTTLSKTNTFSAYNKQHAPQVQSGNWSSHSNMLSPKSRFKDRCSEPGPGSYNVPSTIGVIAPYYRLDQSRSDARQFTTIN